MLIDMPQPILRRPTILYRASAGSNASESATFTNYLTNDVILAFVGRNADTTAITVPSLGFGDNRDWQTIATLSGNSAYSLAAWRRCGTAGLDGSLGTWTNGRPRYISLGGVALADPVGLHSALSFANATSMNHAALSPLESRSAVFVYSFLRAADAGLSPGLRNDATNISVNTGSGIRYRLAHATTIPTPTWAAHAAVPNDTGLGSGGHHVWAVEIRGA